ncbi:phosphopantetheine adenylyltransferase [Nocardia cyriacigeorgica]|uniref:phosphopantetheine adenylyltransferase n=1 Tax=Nocardia cyriacigeorgica TaxID=135487 RepID=UPI001892DB01|nr:phosphopantetheine adenylyltransferase [Nocardia cyriacigeorgica]MBF6496676.1 phosphopantetheine adenylyltransferase [Nocardia cyriacigeorgica]
MVATSTPRRTMPRHSCGRLLLTGAAILNLLPAVAVVSVDRAAGAYGLDSVDGDLRLLLRHRGMLFAILGAGLLVAVFRPRLRTAAITANAVSMAGFLALIPLEQPIGPALLRVARLDAFGLLLLAGAAAAFWQRNQEGLR